MKRLADLGGVRHVGQVDSLACTQPLNTDRFPIGGVVDISQLSKGPRIGTRILLKRYVERIHVPIIVNLEHGDLSPGVSAARAIPPD